MPPKQKVPAPIDRPLSRAYLREFSGWSTAFPPGLSEPTSLRTMENVMVNRDGSLRVRPGLRYLSYEAGFPTQAMAHGEGLVGSHEVFFLNNGHKAYLVGYRTPGNVGVSWRVLEYTPPVRTAGGWSTPKFEARWLDDAAVGFPSSGAGAPTDFTSSTEYVKFLQIDNKIIALSDAGEPLKVFYVGATKKVATPQSITRPDWSVTDKPDYFLPDGNAINDPVTYPPNSNRILPGARTAKTLLPAAASLDNAKYNVGYFYTFSNEVGESAASQVNVVKTLRPWTGWRWETPNASGEPSGTDTSDPAKVADQLIVYPDQAAFDAAMAAGATHFNVYAVNWSDQDPVPVEGTLVGVKALTPGLAFNNCWVRHSPSSYDAARTAPIPSAANRHNYSDPATAAQGIVASDRMVLVNDPAAAAVIRWTSNRMGDYLNFTASLGGGYKTLTSGNLYVPACVKLWQNPESKDTLTVLCQGVDGESAAFYMAPAQVASQSDTVSIMGFEQTTATPGTVSPYGCEVLNNALYHPLESELMKSTASNYTVSHKPMTDPIANAWVGLRNKKLIVSSQLDNRLYYLVHNPDGEDLRAGYRGNEIWVFDTASEGGTWSRWLVQAISLRKIEYDDRVMMSVVKHDGIYAFDDQLRDDDFVNPDTGEVTSGWAIKWRIETNTQGANRAHDAWAHLQQVSLVTGNFLGTIRWGVRGVDAHGKAVDVSKVMQYTGSAPADGLPWDNEDFLSVRRDMKEWRFYAEWVAAPPGSAFPGWPIPSSGQISLIGYRYTPVSVNVGYEYGSVESFEYRRNATIGVANDNITINGVPRPVAGGV